MGEQAVGLLEELGYQSVQLYVGGMVDWTRHRLPVERGRGGEASHTDQSSIGIAGRSSHTQPAFNRHRWERVLIDAKAIRQQYELDVYPHADNLREGETDIIEVFRQLRVEEAQRRKLPPGTTKGILVIKPPFEL